MYYNELMKDWRKWKIEKLDEGRWPEGLIKVRPKVKQLYCRGKWSKDLFKKAVAVVGSRKMTRYGEDVGGRLVRGLVEAGCTIVSGFMYGVDTLAHKVCLENKGKTVAVFGSGLNQVTPVDNDKLYAQILESGGVVVSEFEMEYKAKLWTFPARNRIVAGLSEAVLVIEAGEKSGSLITAKWGMKQGKKVLAVPGAVTGSLSRGTNWLIRNGAVAVTGLEDVLMELPFDKLRVKSTKELRGLHDIHHSGIDLSMEEKQVMELLEREEMGMDELGRELNFDAGKMGRILSEMCLKGLVEERGDKFGSLTSSG